ncbi:MAG TPA: DUF4129 domain-containing protein [Candidatus Methylomirabilis sp.]|nr:DUF4129 domain-containing protein [Candidatus Methylomirabilis sp.]
MRALLPRVIGALPSLGWAALALGGLLAGLVALGSESAGRTPGGTTGRLVLELPSALVTLTTAAGAVAALLWFAFLLALARRRRLDGPQRRALWGALLFPLVMAALALWQRGSPLEGLFRGPLAQLARPAPPGPADAAVPPPAVSLPLLGVSVGALLLAAALASLGIASWLLLGDRLAEWLASASPGERHSVGAAVEESLEDLLAETDPRRAIVRCYRRFEQVLARSRLPRAPWQTSLEFMREALRRLPVPAEAAQRLTRLFERARYSDEAMVQADRDSAWRALVEIGQSLEAGERDVRSG